MARSKPTDATAPSGKAGRGPKDGGRGRPSGSTAAGAEPVKLNRKGKPKKQRLKKLASQARMIKQAYSLTRKNDPKLPWVMLIAFVAVAPGIQLIALLLRAPFLFLPLPILFGRRAQGSAYRQVEGQPGAAAWVLEGMRGDWQVNSGVAGTTQLDAVHRVLGRPGVILVGEGSASRVRPLLAQEKKRIARIAGDAPIYDVLVGDEEGQVPLRKLSAHVMKLPRNLSGGELNALRKRVAALGGARMPV